MAHQKINGINKSDRSKSLDIIKLWQEQQKKLSYAANVNRPHASGPSVFTNYFSNMSSDGASGQK